MTNLPQKMRTGFDGMLEWLLIGTTFLVPVAFIPAFFAPFQFTKSFLIAGLTLIGLAFFIVARMKERRILIPLSPLLGALWLVPFAYLLSSLFSGNVMFSIFGNDMPVDSFAFVAIGVTFATLVVFALRKRESILKVYMAFLVAFFVLALYQMVRIFFGADFLSFGIFTGVTSNLLGSWNDLAIFFGLITILSLVSLVGLTLEGKIKLVVIVALVISLLMLAVVNFGVLWWLVGGFSLATFVYSLTTGRYSRLPAREGALESESHMRELSGEGQTSFASLLVLSISLVFLVGGNVVGSTISSVLGVSQVDVRPSWQSTADVIRNIYSTNPIFGSGPGTFGKEWLLNKSVEVNQTPFWSVDFNSGIGFIPSSLATTGAVGSVAWFIFFGLFLYVGFRVLVMRSNPDPLSFLLTLSSYLGALYLWILSIIYTPGHVLLFLTFLLTGVFIASIRRQPGGFFEKEISFVENPRLGFVAVLFLTIAFLGSIGTLFTIGQRYASAAFFQNSVVALNLKNDIDASEQYVARAVTLNESDAYYRFGTNLNLIRLSEVAQSKDLSEEEVRTQFQAILGAAVQNAQRATSLNPKNYQNWLALAQVYQSVVPLKVEGAYDSAKQAYSKALELNPQSPAIYLGMAQLELAHEDNKAAKEIITTALEKKNNYTEAIFLLAQIQINEGDTDEAIKTVEATTIIEPSNAVNFFQLGVLRYSDKQYTSAIGALSKAVALNQNYSNARYFLGLAYYESGEKTKAIEQFEAIAKLNPDNTEVATILENMKAGKKPLSTSSNTQKVESFDELPVSDGETKTVSPLTE